LPGVGEGLAFETSVQRGQVCCLGGGDCDHELWVAGVADDPAFGGVVAVVGCDFPAEGAGEGGGLEFGAAVFFAAGHL
jgi:hypothetical protein